MKAQPGKGSPWRSVRQKQMLYPDRQTGSYSVHEAREFIPAGSSALAEPQGNTGSSCEYQASRWADRDV